MSGPLKNPQHPEAVRPCDRDTPPAGAEEIVARLEQLRPYLLRIAIDELDSRMRPKVGASDLVQQTLIQAHAHCDELRSDDPATFKAWLRRILLNLLSDSMDRYHGASKRSLAREVALDADSKARLRAALKGRDGTPLESALTQERSDAMEAAIAKLPTDYQQVIHLRCREQLKFAEIGEKLDRSADAARLLWYRATKALTSELKSVTPEPQP